MSILKSAAVVIWAIAIAGSALAQNVADEAAAAFRAVQAASAKANSTTDAKAKAGYLAEAAHATAEFAAAEAKVAAGYAQLRAGLLARLETSRNQAFAVSLIHGGSRQSNEALRAALQKSDEDIAAEDRSRAATADDAAEAAVAASMAEADAEQVRAADAATLAAPAGSAAEHADLAEVTSATRGAAEQGTSAYDYAEKARVDFAKDGR